MFCFAFDGTGPTMLNRLHFFYVCKHFLFDKLIVYCLLQKPKYYTNQDLNSGVLSCFAFNHCGMGSVDKKAQMVWLNLFPFRLLKFEHGFVVFGSAI